MGTSRLTELSAVLFASSLACLAVHCGLDAVGAASAPGSADTDADAPGDAGGVTDGGTSTGSDGSEPGPCPPEIDCGAPDPCPPDGVCEVVRSQTVLDVAVTAAALYWLDGKGAIHTANHDGSNARPLLTGLTGTISGLEADTEHVFWSRNDRLWHASASDGGAVTRNFVVQAGCIRWLAPGTLLVSAPASGTVYSAAWDAEEYPDSVGATQSPSGVAALGPDHLFYADDHLTNGAILMDRGVGQIGEIIITNQQGPRCMATDGTWLWWANRASGTLMKATTAGGNPHALVSEQAGISGIALDATHVYWTWQGESAGRGSSDGAVTRTRLSS